MKMWTLFSIWLLLYQNSRLEFKEIPLVDWVSNTLPPKIGENSKKEKRKKDYNNNNNNNDSIPYTNVGFGTAMYSVCGKYSFLPWRKLMEAIPPPLWMFLTSSLKKSAFKIDKNV